MLNEQQKQHDLETSELRYRRLFETAKDGILLLNAEDGKITDVNPFLLDMLGYTMSELLGRKLWEIGAFKDTAASKEAVATLMKMEYVRYEDLPLETKDGQIKQVEFVSNAYLVDGEKFIQCNIRDITEHKQFQQQFRDKAEMSSRLAAIGEMTAGIAHEINNPLTGVIGFSGLLMEKKDLPEDIRQDLKIINEGAVRVKEIVRHMLTFARQSSPMKSSASITELIDNTLEMRSYILKTANIEVVRDYDPNLSWVMVDPGQLQQVFLNLIVNAEYAMKKAHGKGTLTIKTEGLNGYIRISIKDNGMGISRENLAKLFQPFFTTKEVGEGTGLGLSLSHAIIQEHGGSIRVESELDNGATFIIELPIPPSLTEPQAVVAAAAATRPVKKASILVIDDEPVIRSLIKTMLSNDDHSVQEANTPDKALEKLGSTTYDVILLDMGMPGMSGMELFNRIAVRWPEMPSRVIFITGDTSAFGIKGYLATHRIPCITKPFDRATLEEKVNEVLSK